MPSNSINVIEPYKWHSSWVFDVEELGLKREPFVAGADVIIDLMVKDIPHAAQGFLLTFAAIPFPGAQHEFQWLRAEGDGNWYAVKGLAGEDREGWLCPALLKFFDSPPERLYAHAQGIPVAAHA